MVTRSRSGAWLTQRLTRRSGRSELPVYVQTKGQPIHIFTTEYDEAVLEQRESDAGWLVSAVAHARSALSPARPAACAQ